MSNISRRNFVISLGTIAALPAFPIVPPVAPRDPFEVMTPEEIGRHFIYVDKPVFQTESSAGERQNHAVRTYYTNHVAYRDAWFRPDGSVNETLRQRLSDEHVPHIQRWFGFYQHVWRDKAEVFGPYVHSVRLSDSYIANRRGELYSILMRVAYVRIPL